MPPTLKGPCEYRESVSTDHSCSYEEEEEEKVEEEEEAEKGEKKKKKEKEWVGCNTRTSREVTHPSTTLAQARLTAEF